MPVLSTTVLDIPKMFTAIAEWMACIAALITYRKCISKVFKDRILLVVEIVAAYVLIRVIQDFCGAHDGILWLLGMLAAIAVMVLVLKLVLHLHWDGALYLGARVFIWAELAASLEWQLWHFYMVPQVNLEDEKAALWPAILSYTVIYVLFIILETNAMVPDPTPEKLRATRSEVVGAWVITMMLFALSNLSYIVDSNPFVGTGTADIFYIRTLADIIGVVAAQMFHLQKRDNERREETVALQLTLQNQYIQYHSSQDNIDMINRKYHDLKHQLQVLREETDDERRAVYIDEITDDIRKFEAENKTGNAVLDTILTAKQNRCLKEHITMTVVADGSLLEGIKAMDICTIFGNAVDNAIEHEIRIPEQEKRLIHLTVSEKNHFVCILVENYYTGKPIAVGELPATTKQDTMHHGFGLKSVKYTVEQYGGHINTGVKNNWFRLQMIIPLDTD